MGDNNMWWYKPTTQGYDPAAQAQKNAKQTQNKAKLSTMILDNDVANWDKAKVSSINNGDAPESYVNAQVINAVKWLDMVMSKVKGKPIRHQQAVQYVVSDQATHDAQWLKTQYPDDAGMQQKLDNVIAIVGRGTFGSTASDKMRQEGTRAEKRTYGSLGFLGSKSNDNRTKEAMAIEYAANGNEDNLLNMANDKKSLQKAVQAAYLMYNNSGDERYEQAGETARKLLMHAMEADGDIPDPAKDENGFVDAWQKKKDYVTLILQLSQGADAAATTDAYSDPARYPELRDFIAEANKNIKEHSGGNEPGTANGQPGTMDEALGRK